MKRKKGKSLGGQIMNDKPPNPFWIFVVFPIAAICAIALICGVDVTKFGNSKKKKAQTAPS